MKSPSKIHETNPVWLGLNRGSPYRHAYLFTARCPSAFSSLHLKTGAAGQPTYATCWAPKRRRSLQSKSVRSFYSVVTQDSHMEMAVANSLSLACRFGFLFLLCFSYRPAQIYSTLPLALYQFIPIKHNNWRKLVKDSYCISFDRIRQMN